MNCPACEKSLREVNAGDVKIDICDSGCGGIWFDWLEIKKFDEPHEFSVETLLKAPARDVKKKQGVRFCPKCSDQALCRRFYDMKGQVEVDQCLKCSGIWLDTGELMQIRSQYATEAERIKEADAWLGAELKECKEDLLKDTAEKLNTSVAEVQRIGTDNVIEHSTLTKVIFSLLGKSNDLRK